MPCDKFHQLGVVILKIVGRHRIGRLILIDHLGSDNGNGAAFSFDKIGIRIKRKAGRTTGDGGRMTPTCATSDVEPTAGNGYRLIKIDRDVAINGDVDGTAEVGDDEAWSYVTSLDTPGDVEFGVARSPAAPIRPSESTRASSS